MLIDWFTVIAQAVNFLVLVWLLRRFLYRPILNALDAREALVEKKLGSAAEKSKQAKLQLAEFKQKNDELEKQKSSILTKATDDAKTEGQRLVALAQAQADALRTKQHDALEAEQHLLAKHLVERTRGEVFDISRKALSDLAASTLEERMVDVLDRKLRALSDKQNESLKSAIANSDGGAVVSSAFELPQAQRDTIQALLKDVLSVEGPVHFATAPDLISGIELTANGRKIAWSIADYLRSLESAAKEDKGAMAL